MTTAADDRAAPRFAAATDVGLVRANNEDAYLTAPPLFAVADGMGGHRAGEVASAAAIRTLREEAGHDTDSLVVAVQAANRAVHAEAVANPDLAGMGTTITAMMTSPDSAQIVHVGDSRAYLLRDGRLRRLTKDHTVVERLAREGKIPADEVDRHPQRSVLERALGVSPDVDVDVQLLDLRPGDRLLLSTDGLTSMLDDEEIREILMATPEPEAAAHALVEAALAAGGKDNVTVIVVDFGRRGAAGDDPSRTAEQPAVVLAGGGSGGGSYGSTRFGRPVPEAASPSQAPRSHRMRDAPPAPAHLGDPLGGSGGSGAPAPLNARPGRSRRAKLLLGVVVVIPLLALGVIAGAVALRNSWYVGDHGGHVAIFRGVPGSFAGIRVSTLVTTTDIPTGDLPAVYQKNVHDGITAANRAAAERTAENMRSLQISLHTPATGLPGTTQTTTPTAAATASPAPAPRPSP